MLEQTRSIFARQKNAIELDTLRARRKFKLHRVYPRGVECDDTRTTVKLEGGTLVVDMPITKLPAVVDSAVPAPKPAPQPAPKPAPKRKQEDAAPAKPMAKKQKRASPSQPGPSAAVDGPADERVHELIADASAEADRKRQRELSRMRQVEKTEEEQKQRVAEKQAKREHNKRKLLDTFARHKAASRSEQRAQVAKVAPGPPAKADEPQKKKKRVSFA